MDQVTESSVHRGQSPVDAALKASHPRPSGPPAPGGPAITPNNRRAGGEPHASHIRWGRRRSVHCAGWAQPRARGEVASAPPTLVRSAGVARWSGGRGGEEERAPRPGQAGGAGGGQRSLPSCLAAGGRWGPEGLGGPHRPSSSWSQARARLCSGTTAPPEASGDRQARRLLPPAAAPPSRGAGLEAPARLSPESGLASEAMAPRRPSGPLPELRRAAPSSQPGSGGRRGTSSPDTPGRGLCAHRTHPEPPAPRLQGQTCVLTGQSEGTP